MFSVSHKSFYVVALSLVASPSLWGRKLSIKWRGKEKGKHGGKEKENSNCIGKQEGKHGGKGKENSNCA